MRERKQTPLWALILTLLLLINLIWMTLNFYRNGMFHVAIPAEQFKIETLHTNDVSPWPYLVGSPSAIGVVDKKSGCPVWIKWIFDNAEDADIEGYYFRGKHLFDVYSTNNHPLVYNVYFRGPGKSVTWWRNSGGADTFTERAVYGTNGILSEDQVWYSNTWYVVEVKNGVKGLIINGRWHQLGFDTNGMWMVKTQSDAP